MCRVSITQRHDICSTAAYLFYSFGQERTRSNVEPHNIAAATAASSLQTTYLASSGVGVFLEFVSIAKSLEGAARRVNGSLTLVGEATIVDVTLHSAQRA